ncbi:[protein release factor]-glutamine N5-methyltransferase [Hoeflea marina]|uniref:Release factor glutamine methyltransferase n=1 Tax=Hoeflea marina TaxID=274592 RepID=A0A317PJX6_9HYPH|nr:peptide chain release factor N(5)-glutamine methyltransferase [Hoeflea marina]PWV98027.1 [protein release factor]-glutamine N5-methyltransferase [Hoeflea marina]
MTGAEREPATLGSLLGEARSALRAGKVATPDLDARLLVSGLLDVTTTALLTQADAPVRPIDAVQVRRAVAERLRGRPVHRILGFREFYGQRLLLSAETLEPRPDTEVLVDAVLPHVRAVVDAAGSCAIADLGIGTGAIGLALLAEAPAATCLGIDCSADAVATATANATALGLESRYRAAVGDWLGGLSERFDIIVSNPPYIVTADIERLAAEVRLHDPLVALDGGPDGLAAYRSIAGQVEAHLKPGGLVAVEIGEGQGRDVTAIFAAAGFTLARSHADLSRIERVLVFSDGRVAL